MVEVTTRMGDLLGRLGVPTDALTRKLSDASLSSLKSLRLSYGDEALEANKFGKGIVDGRINLPPFGFNPVAQDALTQLKPFLERSYFKASRRLHPSNADFFTYVMNPKSARAAKLSRLVQENAAVRRSFEKIAGGAVVLDGRTDATLSLRPDDGKKVGTSTSAMTSLPAAPPPNKMYDLLMAMDAEVMRQAASIRPGNRSYTAEFGKGGLIASSNQLGSKEDEKDDDDDEDSAAATFSAFSATGAGPMQNIFDAPQGSIDTQTERLARLMTKRDQMYDVINKMYEKFNQSAKVAIDNARG